MRPPESGRPRSSAPQHRWLAPGIPSGDARRARSAAWLDHRAPPSSAGSDPSLVRPRFAARRPTTPREARSPTRRGRIGSGAKHRVPRYGASRIGQAVHATPGRFSSSTTLTSPHAPSDAHARTTSGSSAATSVWRSATARLRRLASFQFRLSDRYRNGRSPASRCFTAKSLTRALRQRSARDAVRRRPRRSPPEGRARMRRGSASRAGAACGPSPPPDPSRRRRRRLSPRNPARPGHVIAPRHAGPRTRPRAHRRRDHQGARAGLDA